MGVDIRLAAKFSYGDAVFVFDEADGPVELATGVFDLPLVFAVCEWDDGEPVETKMVWHFGQRIFLPMNSGFTFNAAWQFVQLTRTDILKLQNQIA